MKILVNWKNKMKLRCRFLCVEKLCTSHMAVDGTTTNKYSVKLIPMPPIYKSNLMGSSQIDEALSKENMEFFQSVPAGDITLTNVKKEIYDEYQIGAHYFVDFLLSMKPN